MKRTYSGMATDSRASHTTDTINDGWIREAHIPPLSLPALVPQDTTTEFVSTSLGYAVFERFRPNISVEFFLLGAIRGSRYITQPGLELMTVLLHLPTKC